MCGIGDGSYLVSKELPDFLKTFVVNMSVEEALHVSGYDPENAVDIRVYGFLSEADILCTAICVLVDELSLYVNQSLERDFPAGPAVCVTYGGGSKYVIGEDLGSISFTRMFIKISQYEETWRINQIREGLNISRQD